MNPIQMKTALMAKKLRARNSSATKIAVPRKP